MPMLSDFLGFAAKLWPLIAMLAAIGGGFWYFATLDGRVRDLGKHRTMPA